MVGRRPAIGPRDRGGTTLLGRSAVVTGASGGLGREIALGLASAGAHVILQGRDHAALASLLEEIVAASGTADCCAFDLRDEEAIVRAFAERPPVDILVNNAGERARRPLEKLDHDTVRRLLDVNLAAPFHMARVLAARMPAGGRIINVTSIAGQIARGGDAAYTMSKGGLDALTRALAAELGGRDITVNAVAPGFFATSANANYVGDPITTEHLVRRTSLSRWGRPEEIVGPVLFFASTASSYVTGQVLAVDGGYLAHF